MATKSFWRTACDTRRLFSRRSTTLSKLLLLPILEKEPDLVLRMGYGEEPFFFDVGSGGGVRRPMVLEMSRRGCDGGCTRSSCQESYPYPFLDTSYEAINLKRARIVFKNRMSAFKLTQTERLELSSLLRLVR